MFGVQIPVSQGSLTSLNGAMKPRVADFVHGTDGFGNLKVARIPTVRPRLPVTLFVRSVAFSSCSRASANIKRADAR